MCESVPRTVERCLLADFRPGARPHDADRVGHRPVILTIAATTSGVDHGIRWCRVEPVGRGGDDALHSRKRMAGTISLAKVISLFSIYLSTGG